MLQTDEEIDIRNRTHISGVELHSTTGSTGRSKILL